MMDYSSSSVRASVCRLNGRSLLLAVVLFGVLVMLATVGRHWGWVRSFGGDVVAVIWLYYVFHSIVQQSAARIAGAAFGVGVLLELGQYWAQLVQWKMSNPVLRILFGSTPDGWDVLAYAIGAVVVWWIERRPT